MASVSHCPLRTPIHTIKTQISPKLQQLLQPIPYEAIRHPADLHYHEYIRLASEQCLYPVFSLHEYRNYHDNHIISSMTQHRPDYVDYQLRAWLELFNEQTLQQQVYGVITPPITDEDIYNRVLSRTTLQVDHSAIPIEPNLSATVKFNSFNDHNPHISQHEMVKLDSSIQEHPEPPITSPIFFEPKIIKVNKKRGGYVTYQRSKLDDISESIEEESVEPL